MIRALIAALFSWLLIASAGAACIDETAAWSVPYGQGDIQMVTYYVWQQGPPAPPAKPALLAVVFRSGEYHLHQNVPTSVAQQFTSAPNATPIYNSSVKMRYSQILLSQTLCPLRNEDNVYLLGQTP